MQRSKGSDLFVTGLKRETIEKVFFSKRGVMRWIRSQFVAFKLSFLWWSFEIYQLVKFHYQISWGEQFFFCQCDLRGLQSPAARKRQVVRHRNCFIFFKTILVALTKDRGNFSIDCSDKGLEACGVVVFECWGGKSGLGERTNLAANYVFFTLILLFHVPVFVCFETQGKVI